MRRAKLVSETSIKSLIRLFPFLFDVFGEKRLTLMTKKKDEENGENHVFDSCAFSYDWDK